MNKAPAVVRDDIATAESRMHAKTGDGSEINRLESYVDVDEHVDRMTAGLYGLERGLLVLTDRRLIFINYHIMSETAADIPLRNITSVAWQSEMRLGAIVIFTAKGKTEIKNVDQNDGKDFVDVVRARLGVPSPTSAAPGPTALEQLTSILAAM
jgi:Bacterial PH domain